MDALKAQFGVGGKGATDTKALSKAKLTKFVAAYDKLENKNKAGEVMTFDSVQQLWSRQRHPW